MAARDARQSWGGLIFRTFMICLTIAALGAVALYLFFEHLDEMQLAASGAVPAGATAAPAARAARSSQMLVQVCTDGLTLQPQFVALGSADFPRSEQMALIVDEALRSSAIALTAPQGGASTLPFTQRAVYELDGLVLVDLAREPSAPDLDFRGECLMAYSVVNSLADNFDDIHGVQLLIDGAPATTLAGALDISQPLVPNVALRGGG